MENIKTIDEFVKIIDQLVWEKDISYFDAVLEYADKNNIEIEVLASLIKRSAFLKSKIYNDAAELNMVEKVNKLPK